MHDTPIDNAEETGHKLELSTASTLLAEAVTTGDAEALRRAADAHATALNSQATAMAASIAAPLYTKLTEITTLLNAQAETTAQQTRLARHYADQQLDVARDWLGQESKRRDGQADKLYDEINRIIAGQKETQGGIAALSGQFQSLAESVAQLEEDVRANAKRMDASEQDRQNIHDEIASLRQAFDAYAAGSRRGELDDIHAQLRELRGDYTDDQRRRYTTILMQIIGEYEAAHPEADA